MCVSGVLTEELHSKSSLPFGKAFLRRQKHMNQFLAAPLEGSENRQMRSECAGVKDAAFATRSENACSILSRCAFALLGFQC